MSQLDSLMKLLTLLGAPMQQLVSQRSGGGIMRAVRWNCGCEAVRLEHLEYKPCAIHEHLPEEERR